MFKKLRPRDSLSVAISAYLGPQMRNTSEFCAVILLAALPSMAIYLRSQINKVTDAIIGSAIEVHRHLGPGLFESAYHSCVVYELRQRGLRFTSRRSLPLTYKSLEIDAAYEIDLWVEDLIVVELKCVRELTPVHEAQTITYVKLTGAPVGLLINVDVPLLKDGIRRVINPEHEVIDDFDPTQRHKLVHAQTTAIRSEHPRVRDI